MSTPTTPTPARPGPAGPQGPTASPSSIRSALTFFRVAATVAGLAMFVLIVEMVLKYGLHDDALSWWSPVHGLIFMVFAVATANLGLKVGWPVGRMLLALVLACIPFVAFVEERRVTREVTPLTR